MLLQRTFQRWMPPGIDAASTRRPQGSMHMSILSRWVGLSFPCLLPSVLCFAIAKRSAATPPQRILPRLRSGRFAMWNFRECRAAARPGGVSHPKVSGLFQTGQQHQLLLTSPPTYSKECEVFLDNFIHTKRGRVINSPSPKTPLTFVSPRQLPY